MSGGPACRSPSRAGFTLVEVLLSLALLGIIVSIIYTSLVRSVQVKETVEGRLETYQVARALLDRMTRELQAATLPPYNKQAAFVGIEGDLDGQPWDALHFVSLDPADQQGSGVDQAEIGYAPQFDRREERRVLLRREDVHIDDNPLEGGMAVEVAERVESLRVRHFDGREWQRAWDSRTTKTLPTAVEITLVLRDREGMPATFRATIPLVLAETKKAGAPTAGAGAGGTPPPPGPPTPQKAGP